MPLSKQELRKYFQKLRTNLSEQSIDLWSKEICKKVLHLPNFQSAKKIGLYMPLPKEVQIQSLLQQPKEIYLPVVQPDMHLEFYLYDVHQTMQQNQWHIDEPSSNQLHIEIQELDIILVPMLAFDTQGQRLGMGKGCYDRTLTYYQNFKIGIAFDMQESEYIRQEKTDIAMNMIITEKRILTF